MTPVPEWRRLLKHGYSVRFHAASVALSSAGSALMLLNPEMTGHPVIFAAVVFALAAAGGILGIVAQVMQQRNLGGQSAS